MDETMKMLTNGSFIIGGVNECTKAVLIGFKYF